MNLFGSTKITSIDGKKYDFIIIDDLSRFIWILFFAHKDEVFEAFSKFFKNIINEKDLDVLKIRSDHRNKFKNQEFN